MTDIPAADHVGREGHTIPLLATKLYVPWVRASLVPRTRLDDRLSEGTRGPLTLVSAPAGFGKSTLLSAWVRGVGARAAWLSLDSGDNDPTRFWAYLVAALQRLHPAVGEGALALLRSPQPAPVETVVTLLINDLAAIPDGLVLVLDDYHAVEAQTIHAGVSFLLDHLPPQMHVVIASRTDPPLPLALWRSRGQLTELRAADLRFTPEEAATFLNQAMGLSLTAAEVAALGERTEGWVAGLQLAALSLQGAQGVTGSAEAFSGSHRYVFDYLAQEVLSRQPESVQAFLLETAILERLTGPLCDAVTGRDDGQATLESLEHANLFLVPLDPERRWYRYHQLFAEFLRSRLAQTQPERVPDLHRRAASWCQERGHPAEAVGHALAAQDPELAWQLIARATPAMFEHNELMTLKTWLRALPGELVRGLPALAMAYAWTLLATGEGGEVEPILQAIEEHLGIAVDDAARDAAALSQAGGAVHVALAEIAVVRANLAIGASDAARAFALSQQALALLAGREEMGLFNAAANLIGPATFDLGLAYEQMGDVEAASDAFSRAVARSREDGNAHILLLATSHLAQLQILHGRLRQARDLFEDALHAAAAAGRPPSPLAGVVHTALGDLLREWDDLAGAIQHLEAGIALAHQWANLEALASGLISVARVKQAQGDTDSALEALAELAAAAARAGSQAAWVPPLVEACRVRLWLVQGRVERAARWQEEHGLRPQDPVSYRCEPEQIMLARLLLAQGKADQAADLLSRLLAAAEAGGRLGRAIEIRILLALACRARGDNQQALDELGRALLAAEPEGYVRTFVDEGEPVKALLLELKEQKELGELTGEERSRVLAYTDHLLKALAGHACLPASAARLLPSVPSVPPVPSVPSLSEPLSPRELEVLGLLAAGLSNQEIAERLVVSLNTVKTHVKNIYAKLDAGSRTRAIARARELGLL